VCASALLHLGGVVALSERELAPVPARAVAAPSYAVPFQPLEGTSSTGEQLRIAERPPEVVPGGQPIAGTLDQEQLEGRGGELQALESGALLFPFVSPLTLQDTELNNLAVNQVQRIRTARARATQEERRSTPQPADAVLLASGVRGHEERRDPAKRDTQLGAPRRALPSPASQLRHARAASEEGESEPPAPAREETRVRPAQGILRGRGALASRAAKVTFARPNIDRGAAATPAERLDERIRDDADSELLAAKLQRSFVDTSVQRAQKIGPGSGGTALQPDAIGQTGSGRGASARPYMPGAGGNDALDTSDTRYLRWFTQQRARVQRELVFPRARALAKDQGTSLYSVVLGRDGKLSGTPRLIRSSGYADFDAAAAIAIERALPFSPLPAELAPDVERIALLIPVAFSNPMIE
jgi:TonB family protein